MSKIQINSLQPAGSDLFQGGESFLTELQPTEAHTIFGGSGSSSGGNRNRGNNFDFIFVPVPVAVPQYGHGCPAPVYPNFPGGFPRAPRRGGRRGGGSSS